VTEQENINRTRDHAELLMNVREDINQFKSTTSSSRAETLLRERNALHASGRAVDDLIDHAITTRDHLSGQKSRLQGSHAKVNNFSGRYCVA
jgi:Snare region anchored in the vesicle membrane C-terminus